MMPIIPENASNVDNLIEAMKTMFKKLNPDAVIDRIVSIFNKHVKLAQDAIKQRDS